MARIEGKVSFCFGNNRWRYLLALFVALITVSAASADPVKITHGPVVESTDAHHATIAWSTNTSAATIVHYSTDPNNLSEKAEMPWGALTHRVTLKNLQPGTTYYFQADSSQGEDSGSEAVSQTGSFTTPADRPSIADH